MKQNPHPQLMSMIKESGGRLTLPYYTLKNFYFKKGWDELTAWAGEHGVKVFPNRVPQSPDDPVRLSL